MVEDPHKHYRITHTKIGPHLSENVNTLTMGCSEQERQAFQQSVGAFLNDAKSTGSNYAYANIQGPFTLTVDTDPTHAHLTLENAAGETRAASLPMKELKGFIGRYWNNLEPYANGRHPVAERRVLIEEARRQTHEAASARILAALDEHRISAPKGLGESIFGMLYTTHISPEVKNPCVSVALKLAQRSR